MTTVRRAAGLIALMVSLVLGASALDSAATAYPPGHHAQVSLSASRVDHGQTITISGAGFRPSAHVVITVTCHGSNPKKRYVATYRTRASGGTFSKTITITSDFPSGRCVVNARTGRRAENSDNATFFVNTPGHGGNGAGAVGLAAATVSGTSAGPGSGSGLGALLIGGLCLLFLAGGVVLLLTGRRKFAVVRS